MLHHGPGKRVLALRLSVEPPSLRKYLLPEEIGYRAMMVLLSDMAAMGVAPRQVLVSLGIPARPGDDFGRKIRSGIREAAEAAGAFTAEGDTFSSRDLIISLALGGERMEREPAAAGAAPGEIIYLTGTTGDAAAGLAVIRSGKKKDAERYPFLAGRCRRPLARFGIAREIVQIFHPSAMTSTADGLLAALGRLCAADRPGFILYPENLPLSGELSAYGREGKKDIRELALRCGGDCELLFTSPKDLTETMNMTINRIPVTAVGCVTNKGFRIVTGGKAVDLPMPRPHHRTNGDKS